MKILFIGTVRFSEKMLRKLIAINAEVVGVITGPDTGTNADYADLAAVCGQHDIDCQVTEQINDSDSITWAKEKNPDVVFCFGWSRLLSEEIIDVPKIGVVGFHPTALPKNRGRHPLIWTLVLGLEETASTFFLMDAGADSGDILSQQKIPVTEDDNAQSLYEKVEQTAENQLAELVTELQSDNYVRIQQDESQATYWRKRSVKDGIIDWRMSARLIHNLVRGLSRPYVGAEFEMRNQRYKLWQSRPVTIDGLENIEPDITELGHAVVKCGEGCLELIEIEPGLVLEKGMYL